VLKDLGATLDVVRTAVVREMGLPPRPPVAEGLDGERFREVMSTFPSGVVVLTAFGDDDRPRGLTVSAFCAVSLEPPLALVCIDMTSNTLPALSHSGGFTANILASGREQLARRMATKLSDKFEGIEWRRPTSPLGGPILEHDAAAYAVCTLRDTIEAGDHWVLIGLVTEGAQFEGVKPMVFTRRAYT
jgi:flavin reductase (DIM6/NTAB) family NADH-FMN oxidoreductase RutF